jgi:long-chain acyl-CoA synthetase
MLYDRWQQIVRSCPERIALRDLAAGCAWTFGELQASAETEPAAPGPIAFPQGTSAEFILTLLGAWHTNQVVCPLELGQTVPTVSGPLPSGVTHLKLTSATTGPPRLVAFTNEQLMADARNIVTTMGLNPEWPNLGVISLAHSYGFSNLVLPLLLHGVPLILVGSPLPEAVRRAAVSEEAVTLAAVPALWANWHEANALPRNVRLAVSAGAPLPLKLEQSVFDRSGVKIHNFYGSSECGGIAYDAAGEPRRDGACAGAPLANVEVSVNGSGCLQVRGEAVGQTYWPEPSPNLRDGVFRTTDLAEIAGGMVYLRGRASDQINVAGRKISPEVIEEALSAHPCVSECVAFGAPSTDADRGEVIVACLAVKEKVGADVLKQYLMTKLPAWQVPREWCFVESFVVNNRGKLSRAEWRRRYLERVLGA